MKNLEPLRHSLAHILMQALERLYNAVPAIGPAIENGFYHDFDANYAITTNDLIKIETEMRKIIAENLIIDSKILPIKEGIDLLRQKKYTYTKELAEELQEKGESELTFYSQGEFINMCKGPHLKSTGEINPEAFKLTKISGAYWRGNEKNKMLQRVYGVAFETKVELENYLNMLEEAEKRDHRKLGRELDLFHIDDCVGSGLPLWHPKGALLWRIVEDFWYSEHLKNGYKLVRSPHIGNRTLWEISGHWGFYNESMYPPLEVGQTLEDRQKDKKAEISEEYLLKPMNCPFHVQIYKANPHSYRDLPLRWAECGTVYRYEKKGELSGLTRVRGFTQDDAHIICRKDQVEDELEKVVDFILFMYQAFGFKIEDVHVYLSVRDPQSNKYPGAEEGWNFTESVLEKIAIKKNLIYTKDVGGAAFYGPKLDFKIKDTIGREWQCSTLQFDFNLPARFNMRFINSEGQEEAPYMLHRALFGSFERFLGLLIEHYAGAFPIWLSPVQVRILSIGGDHHEYAQNLAQTLRNSGVRAEADNNNETLGNKIRKANQEKIPYLIITGDKEINSGRLAVRERGSKETREMEVEEFVKLIKE